MPFVYDFDHQPPPPADGAQGPPRRQGRQPGRDDVGARAAGAATASPSPPTPAGPTSTAAGPRGCAGELTTARPSAREDHGQAASATRRDPLLVSVRSGAKFSMPGMMDTVLNLGLNDESVEGLAKQTDDERFAFDSYRRFVAMYGRIVLGIDGDEFDALLEAAKELAGADERRRVFPSSCSRYLVRLLQVDRGAPHGHSLSPGPRRPVARRDRGGLQVVERARVPSPIATTRASPTTSAPRSTSRPWCSATATTTRGRAWASPGTRPRAPRASTAISWSTPRARTWWPASATPLPLSDAARSGSRRSHTELIEIFDRLEHHYRDMCDTEFTIDQGKLWMLQTRVGKRTGRAALADGRRHDHGPGHRTIHAEEAVQRVTRRAPRAGAAPALRGHRGTWSYRLGARRPRRVQPSGAPIFDADDAEAAAARGERVILVRSETSPEDVHGMIAAEGILTARGGLVSHAAVVARGWGKPAVVGAESIRIEGKTFTVGGSPSCEGD